MVNEPDLNVTPDAEWTNGHWSAYYHSGSHAIHIKRSAWGRAKEHERGAVMLVAHEFGHAVKYTGSDHPSAPAVTFKLTWAWFPYIAKVFCHACSVGFDVRAAGWPLRWRMGPPDLVWRARAFITRNKGV